MVTIITSLAEELGQKYQYVENVVTLLDEGNTIPFIARYRKELHGGMDDTTLRNLETRLVYLRNLQERKEEIIRSIDGQEKLTPELEAAIMAAKTLAEAEDLYRPISRSVAPAQPLLRRRDWSRWRLRFLPKTAKILPNLQRALSILKGVWKPWRMLWRAPMILLQK